MKITKDDALKVEVSNEVLLDFTYSNQNYITKIDNLLGKKDSIKRIFIVQKYFLWLYIINGDVYETKF